MANGFGASTRKEREAELKRNEREVQQRLAKEARKYNSGKYKEEGEDQYGEEGWAKLPLYEKRNFIERERELEREGALFHKESKLARKLEQGTRASREAELKRNEREVQKRLDMERRRYEHEQEVQRVMEAEKDIEESKGGYSQVELAAAKAKQAEEKESRKRREERIEEQEFKQAKIEVKKAKSRAKLEKEKAKYMPGRIEKADRKSRKAIKAIFGKSAKKKSHGGIHLF